jgi:DNA-binding NtrC family response regulator
VQRNRDSTSEEDRTGTRAPVDQVIAILNNNNDTLDMLRECLKGHGFARVVTGRVDDIRDGAPDFLAFVAEHCPAVFVYDIPIPYEEHWAFLRAMTAKELMKGRRILVTTTNKWALESMVGPTSAIEVLGKPYDLAQIVAGVERMLQD